MCPNHNLVANPIGDQHDGIPLFIFLFVKNITLNSLHLGRIALADQFSLSAFGFGINLAHSSDVWHVIVLIQMFYILQDTGNEI